MDSIKIPLVEEKMTMQILLDIKTHWLNLLMSYMTLTITKNIKALEYHIISQTIKPLINTAIWPHKWNNMLFKEEKLHQDKNNALLESCKTKI